MLAGVDGVMLLRHLAGNGQQAQSDDLQALALEAADDLADEAALHGVGLGQDEGALHYEERLPVRVDRLRRFAARS